MCGRVGGGSNKTALSSVGRGAVFELPWANHPREFDSRRCLRVSLTTQLVTGRGLDSRGVIPHAVFDPQVRHGSFLLLYFFLSHSKEACETHHFERG